MALGAADVHREHSTVRAWKCRWAYSCRLGCPRAGRFALDQRIRERRARSGLDGRILAFTAGVGFFTAVLFGLVPALRAARSGLEAGLHASGRSFGGRRGTISKGLVAAQVALSLPL